MARFEARRNRDLIDVYHCTRERILADLIETLTVDEAIEFAADLLELAADIKARD